MSFRKGRLILAAGLAAALMATLGAKPTWAQCMGHGSQNRSLQGVFPQQPIIPGLFGQQQRVLSGLLTQ